MTKQKQRKRKRPNYTLNHQQAEWEKEQKRRHVTGIAYLKTTTTQGCASLSLQAQHRRDRQPPKNTGKDPGFITKPFLPGSRGRTTTRGPLPEEVTRRRSPALDPPETKPLPHPQSRGRSRRHKSSLTWGGLPTRPPHVRKKNQGGWEVRLRTNAHPEKKPSRSSKNPSQNRSDNDMWATKRRKG